MEASIEIDEGIAMAKGLLAVEARQPTLSDIDEE